MIMIVERKFFEFGGEVGDGDAELEALPLMPAKQSR